jgi:hypothetical protein
MFNRDGISLKKSQNSLEFCHIDVKARIFNQKVKLNVLF